MRNIIQKIGCDVVSISRFEKALREGGAAFRDRVFLPCEYKGASPERLAGVFAAKEAALKATARPPGRWLDFCVVHDESGAPGMSSSFRGEIEISIAHDGDYAFAVALTTKK